MKINPINFTHTHSTNHLKAKEKPVSFGFGEDYGKDYFVDTEYENDVTPTPWEAIKGAVMIMTFPISFPVILYNEYKNDTRDNKYYREILAPETVKVEPKVKVAQTSRISSKNATARPRAKGPAKGPAGNCGGCEE